MQTDKTQTDKTRTDEMQTDKMQTNKAQTDKMQTNDTAKNSPTPRTIPIAILFSGRGSNMQALAAHIARPDVPAKIVLTISNRPDAKGIAFCKQQNLPCTIIDHKAYENRAAFDAALHTALLDAGAELICAAGFMRLLTDDFVNKWQDRIINIHPSLLPRHRGLHTHEAVLAAGDKEHGCTVHYMRPQMDSGPILIQRRIKVETDDTPESLATRVLAEEHLAYPQALDKVLARLQKQKRAQIK